MEEPRTYATAGAFRSALEERLKSISQTEQMDLNRLRRQVTFDRFLARLFQVEPAPWALKGGYALELRFKTARSTIDIDLTVRPVGGATGQAGVSRVVREMLQDAASVSLDDWFEFRIGSPVMDLEAAPYGGARYLVEARMDGRVFSRFHLDAGIGDAVMQPMDNRMQRVAGVCRDQKPAGANDSPGTAVRGEAPCLYASAEQRKQQGERPGRPGTPGSIRRTRRGTDPRSRAPDVSEKRNPRISHVLASATSRLDKEVRFVGRRVQAPEINGWCL